MNIKSKNMKHFLCFFMLCFFVFNHVAAQTNTVTVGGVVTDSSRDPLIGVSIGVKGASTGTTTDIDGNFTLKVTPGSTLVFSYVGYHSKEVLVDKAQQLSVILQQDSELLEEVIVIGYGSVKKKDLTGSISAIGEKEFNKGVVTSPAQLLSGKVSGVQITSNGGRAGAGSTIRIRGGASLNASNDPLIVVDGVPISSGLSGSSDALSMINPSDIESMNILKDASATAIYGSRASNGVILITTKKGASGKMSINITSNNSLSYNSKKVDVLSGNQFRDLVNTYGNTTQINRLGEYNTDWQDEIYRTAFTTDNNVSLSGKSGILPYYVSLSFLDNNGILKTDNMKRTSMAVNLTPKFLDDHLSVSVNLKGTISNARFGNGDAIGAALRMDPTQPVKAAGYDMFNGYWSWMANDKDPSKGPLSLGTKNPVALLESKKDKGDTYRSIGNMQLDYKMHFLPELKANLNLGYDIAKGKGKVSVPTWAPQAYTLGGENKEDGGFYPGGERSKYEQTKRNLLMEFFLNYNKTLEEIKSSIDVMGGYSYQDWKTTDNLYVKTTYDGTKELEVPAFAETYAQNTLISYFGRLNYTFMDKYMLTASVRRDGSSRFSKDHRWGTFPSGALAWRINEEDFMKGFKALYNLKLRLGVGKTGQQEIDNYGYIASFSPSGNEGAYYQFGDQYYSLWRPDAYDPNRKWETTTTYNGGLDYGFFNNRVYGSVDVYFKKTKDLLNTVPLAIGENNTNQITKNIGSMENKGVELSLTVVPIDNKNITWEMSANATYNNAKITKLTVNDNDPNNDFILLTGDISGGTGTKIQRHAVGHAPSTFYMYKQLYNANGSPIDGSYADLNGDGVIDDKDRYMSKSSIPKWFLGFNTSFRYQSWTLSTSLRSNIGAYVYNNFASNNGVTSEIMQNDFSSNGSSDIFKTWFSKQNLLSDYYLQNATFLKMDYLTLSYEFPKIFKNINRLAASFTVQNVFTATKYKGVDPEISGGIDNNFYPNPRTFLIGINLNF